MTLFVKNTALSISIVLLSVKSEAFAPAAHFGVSRTHSAFHSTSSRSLFSSTPLRVTTLDQEQQQTDTAGENEVERLKSMAAKLRAEAAALEADQMNEMSKASSKAFQKFDADNDGEVTLEELKAGLEKAFKMELPKDRVQDLMKIYDKSGDGALQLEEFVVVDKLRNQLEQLDRQEKEARREAAKQQQEKAQAAQEAEARLALISESINEKEPTNTEKALSVLPYLLPLVDILPYGHNLLETNQDNPLVMGLVSFFALYRAIPLGGLIAYGILGALRENLGINKLIRFNANQAIYLDIAVFVPAILTSIVGLVAGATGGSFEIPPGVTELGQEVLFATMVLLIGYSAVSSFLGATPDKIPFISDAVSKRMPSIDMFDAEGKFIGPDEEKNDTTKDE